VKIRISILELVSKGEGSCVQMGLSGFNALEMVSRDKLLEIYLRDGENYILN